MVGARRSIQSDGEVKRERDRARVGRRRKEVGEGRERERERERERRACPELPRGVYRPFDLRRSSLLPRSIDTSYFYG